MQVQTMRVAYLELLKMLAEHGVDELNTRTKEYVRVLEGGWSFKLDLSNGYLPLPSNRRYFPATAAAEVAWQLMGTKNPTFIVKHAPAMWSKFIEDGELKTAYGYRWRNHFGRDQLAAAVEELKNNPTNRQLFISAWDPSCDGLGGPQPKNIPCPIGFTLSRVAERIHCSVFIRSSDVIVGLPYDVMAYALLLDAIGGEIDVTPGTLHVTLAHPHYYYKHAEIVQQTLVDNDLQKREPLLPFGSIRTILDNPDDYVDFVKKREANYSKWSPKPEVIE